MFQMDLPKELKLRDLVNVQVDKGCRYIVLACSILHAEIDQPNKVDKDLDLLYHLKQKEKTSLEGHRNLY